MITEKRLKFKSGQLLIEVLIGISILAILMTAIIPLLLTSSMGVAKSQKDETATFLAKEQIEAARALKEQDWNNIYFPLNTSNKTIFNPYHLVLNGSSWQLATGPEDITQNGVTFRRSIMIDNVSRSSSNGAGNIESSYTASRDDPSTQRVRSIVTATGGTPITITEYFSRWSNQLWTQTDWSGGVGVNWQSPPANTYSSLSNIDPLTSAGALLLAKTGSGGTGNYGNRSLLTSTGTIGRLNTAAKRDDMRFTAQKTGSLNQLRVYLNNASNSGAINYRYGIQADSSGSPSGIYLGSQTAAFSTTGWQVVNLPVAINVTSGTVYHLVVQYDSGTAPNGNRYIDIRNSAPQNNLVPQNQAIDVNQNTLFFSGSWAVQNQEPIYVLGFNDGSFEGNPFDSFEARSIFGANFEGEKFTVNSDMTISNLNLYIAKSANQNPAAALRVVLRDLTTSANIVDDSSITGAALTTTFQWKAINFPGNLTLTSTHQYRLYLSSQGSVTNRHYDIYCESNPDNAVYNNINWDGTNSVTSRSVNTGGSFTESNFIDMTGYYFTTILPQSYANSGELISSTYNFSKRAGLNRILWSFPVLPAGTSIKMQLAANNDNTTWNYFGPDGTGSSYYTIGSGENPYYQLSNNQYLRYKVRLETTNPQVTPTLNDITINFSP